MNQETAHTIIDEIINEARIKKLYGSAKFTLHFQDGDLRQATHEQHDTAKGIIWKQTHRGKPNG